jgi:hypothetical protein
MFRRLVVSLVAAAVLVYAGTDALGAAIYPAPLKIIATVVAHAHADTRFVARY